MCDDGEVTCPYSSEETREWKRSSQVQGWLEGQVGVFLLQKAAFSSLWTPGGCVWSQSPDGCVSMPRPWQVVAGQEESSREADRLPGPSGAFRGGRMSW